MYELSLDGQTAIVTGADVIGRAIAVALARAGADVAVASRTVPSWRPRPRTSARSDAARSSCRPT